MIHRKIVRYGIVPLLLTSLFGEVAVKFHHEKPKVQENSEDPENPHGNRSERMEVQARRSVEAMLRFANENRGQRNGGGGGGSDPTEEILSRTVRSRRNTPS